MPPGEVSQAGGKRAAAEPSRPRRKVTLSLPGHTVVAAQAAAKQAGAPFSTYVVRALRNEALRQQLAASPLHEDGEWLDMAEADEADGS